MAKVLINEHSHPNIPDEDVIKLSDLGFTIGKQLDSGTYGRVYEAEASSIHDIILSKHTRKLAIKFINYKLLRPNSSQNCETSRAEVIDREKMILTRITHKNVMTVKMCVNLSDDHHYEIPDREGIRRLRLYYDRVYIMMDFANEGTLKQMIDEAQSRRAINECLVKNVCKQLAEGLKYLHSVDVYHGDVHTRNVLLTRVETSGHLLPKWSDLALSGLGTGDHDFRLDVEHLCTRVFEPLLEVTQFDNTEYWAMNLLANMKSNDRMDLNLVLAHPWLEVVKPQSSLLCNAV